MYRENDIKQVVEQVLAEVMKQNEDAAATPEQAGGAVQVRPDQDRKDSADTSSGLYQEGEVPDITAQSLKEQFFVPHPINREEYLRIKHYTPARIGVWRAGPRYNTFSMLRFRIDHAAAQDAVFSDTSEECIRENALIPGKTLCTDRDEYVTRPDLGRILDDDTKALFKGELHKEPVVQLVVGDGLSSAAIEANIADIIPSIKQGLSKHGIETGPIPFIKYCRVGAMDQVEEIVNADVVCLLIGERPGLVTAESMSAYMAYKPTVGMPESRRTVVSNIHRGGTPAVEAGAHIADLLKMILDAKVSGVELSL